MAIVYIGAFAMCIYPRAGLDPKGFIPLECTELLMSAK